MAATATKPKTRSSKPCKARRSLPRGPAGGDPAEAGLRPDPGPGAPAPDGAAAERHQLCVDLGHQSQPAVSHHLRCSATAG